jgi:hypothetical protein
MAGLAASSPALQNEMGESAESTIVTLNGVQLTGKLLYASGGSLVLLKNYDNNGKWWNSLSKQE